MLRIGVLGPVTAQRDGIDLDVGGPRQRAVLAVLVAAGPGRLVSADRFVEDLWSGEPPPKALAALHAYISRLRRVLEPERAQRRPASVITSVPPGYRLELPADAVDAWQFEALVSAARRERDPAAVVELVERAEAGWLGEPFAAYADQPWAVPVTESLREARAAAVELRAGALLALGQTGSAIAALLRHVHNHPLREQAVELLAGALYRDGRQGEALAALAQIKRDLADELGVDPGPRLRALEADILAQAEHLSSTTPPAGSPAAAQVAPAATAEPPGTAAQEIESTVERPLSDPTFVGRQAELERVLRCLDTTASARRPGVVWVVGEAGIGKSRLAERVAELVAGRAVVARGRCPEVDGAPAGWAWIEVLSQLGDDEPDPAVRDAFSLSRMVENALAAYPDRPVLVILDDVHRADDETLQVLRHVSGAVRQPLLVIGTVRAESAGPALGATLAAVADRTLDRIELRGLDPDASAALLVRFGRRVLPGSTETELVTRSGGNPLFLREIGQLVAAEGPAAGLAVPPVIRELLTRRVERLPEPVVELLARAAALGRDVDLDLLIRVEEARSGLTEDDVLGALDTGLVAGVLDLTPSGTLRFAHVLTRDTLLERLAPLRRRRLHQDVVGVLERDYPDRVDALAHHAAAGLDARTAERAATHLETAAKAAAAIPVQADVVRHARGALRALDLIGAESTRRLRCLRLLGTGLADTGEVAAARAVRREAVTLAERHGTPRDIAEQLTWDAPTVWTIRALGALEPDLVDRLEQALDGLADGHDGRPDQADVALRVRLLASLVLETESSPLIPRAEEAAAEAVALARSSGDARLLCQALNAEYLLTSPPRPPAGQRRVGEELLAASRSARLVGYEAVAHHVLFGAAAGAGDLATAQAEADLAVQCAAAGQLPALLGVSALFAGAKQLVHGDLAGAERIYSSVTQQMDLAGDPHARAMQMLLRFTVAHTGGDVAALGADLRPLLDAGHLPGHDLAVRSALASGDVGSARQLWGDRTPLVHSYLWDFFRAVRAENAAQLGDLTECQSSLDDLAPFAGRFAGLSSGSMTLGPVDYFLGLVATALGEATQARRFLQDARRLAVRHGNGAWARQADEALDRLGPH